MNYRIMEGSDYDGLLALWKESDGVRIRDADSREGVELYLARNPELSFVAELDGEIIGTIMSGHDGRRGIIQHLAVKGGYRRQGIAVELVSLCAHALEQNGILKSYIHILNDNTQAMEFWSNRGWEKRDDFATYSFISDGSENA